MYQAGAVLRIILIGYLSDSLIKNDDDRRYKCHSRSPVIFLNALMIIGILHAYSNFIQPGASKGLLSCLQFCAGVLIEGSANLISVAMMDCVAPEMFDSSYTMANFLAQFGAFFAGFPFGHIVKNQGWSYAFIMLESISVVNVLISSCLLIRNYTNSTSLLIKKYG